MRVVDAKPKDLIIPYITAAQYAALGNNPPIGAIYFVDTAQTLYVKVAAAVWKKLETT